MDKNIEILNKQKRQNELKHEVKEIKKKLPSLIIGFVFFTFISLYFLEDRFYQFFGNNANFAMSGAIILGVFTLFYIYRSYLKIKKKQKEAKLIGAQLYKLMKLEVETKNE